MNPRDPLVDMAARIVTAYVAAHEVPAEQLPTLLQNIHAALKIEKNQSVDHADRGPALALPVRKSYTDDVIICLICKKPLRTLKRHLKAAHAMELDAYFKHFDLPYDYPTVTAEYSARRSDLARRNGFGAIGEDTAED